MVCLNACHLWLEEDLGCKRDTFRKTIDCGRRLSRHFSTMRSAETTVHTPP